MARTPLGYKFVRHFQLVSTWFRSPQGPLHSRFCLRSSQSRTNLLHSVYLSFMHHYRYWREVVERPCRCPPPSPLLLQWQRQDPIKAQLHLSTNIIPRKQCWAVTASAQNVVRDDFATIPCMWGKTSLMSAHFKLCRSGCSHSFHNDIIMTSA